MDHTEAAYASALHQAFPDHVLKAILLGIVDGYRVTPTACKKAMDLPDRHDVFGHIRRGKINEQLRGVGDRHQIQCRDEFNSAGSACFLSMMSGEFRLAAHLVGRRRTRIRPARIREEWAAYNHDGRWGQFDFAATTASPLPAGGSFVAFLIHGPRGRHRDQPAFVEIVVPDNHLNTYIYRLDLFKRFPQVAVDVVRGRDQQTRKLPRPKRNRGKEEGLA